jgi:hypothetical protein
MRSISERHLAVLIPLLAAKIRDLRRELRATDGRVNDLNEEQLDDRVQLQDMLDQYENILDDLRTEYEGGLAEGINLPTYEELTARFRTDQP